MREAFDSLKYKIYADDFRNFGCKTSILFKFHSKRSRLLILLRLCNTLSKVRSSGLWSIIIKIFRKICFVLLNRVEGQLGVEISPFMRIGEGLFLPHPNGIILHGKAIIGKNCTILQQVTIGNTAGKDLNDVAIIGDNVTIGAGAKIIGQCNIGNNVIIGANAVVVKDVPCNSVVAGVPARIISNNVFPAHNSDY